MRQNLIIILLGFCVAFIVMHITDDQCETKSNFISARFSSPPYLLP